MSDMDHNALRHGRFGWVELMTTNDKTARDFYQTLFGWEYEDWPMGEATYSVIKVDDEPVGGIMPNSACEGECPPHWGVYVTVDDVDNTAREAEKLGGTILVPPRDIPEIGRFTVIQDPQGAVISAITYRKR